jgi:hypothetical protein
MSGYIARARLVEQLISLYAATYIESKSGNNGFQISSVNQGVEAETENNGSHISSRHQALTVASDAHAHTKQTTPNSVH